MRVSLVAAGTVATLLVLWWVLTSVTGPTRPNVILIVIDTLRADHLSCHGYDRPTSPRLDELARRGVRFGNARAPSSWTGASVASILTGLYPSAHGVERNTSILSPQVPTIAEAFRDAGYKTAAFSANPVFVTPEAGLGQGFASFEVMHGPPVSRAAPINTVPTDPWFKTSVEVATADQMTDAAIAWIGRHGGTPFFLYVHYFDPHSGYFPPPEYAARFGVDLSSPSADSGQPAVPFPRRSPVFPENLARSMALYDAEIAFTDEHVGRLLDAASEGSHGPTLTVVTADHGEEFGDHGGIEHGKTLWDEQLHVPLIFAGADVPAGVTVDTPVSLVGIWPTIAELTGIAVPAQLARHSLAGLFDGAAIDPAAVYADLAVARRKHGRALMQGSWKLLVPRKGKASLYNLATDPDERHDLAATERARVEILRAALRRRDFRTSIVRARAAPGKSRLTSPKRAQLKALGYLD